MENPEAAATLAARREAQRARMAAHFARRDAAISAGEYFTVVTVFGVGKVAAVILPGKVSETLAERSADALTACPLVSTAGQIFEIAERNGHGQQNFIGDFDFARAEVLRIYGGIGTLAICDARPASAQ